MSGDTKPIGPGAFIDASDTVINYKGRNYYSAEGIDENASDGYHTFKELYQYRLLYNAALFNEWFHRNAFGVHKSERHSDGEPAFGGGWFVVMAELPTGQISNHYELKDWGLFRIPNRVRADEWDGHTPADVTDRLLRFLRPSQLFATQIPKEKDA